MVIKLAVILTNGNIRQNGYLQPTPVGKMRLLAANTLLDADPHWKLAIIGGLRDTHKESEAQVYKTSFTGMFPEHAKRIALVDAYSKYTAKDMLGLAHALAVWEQIAEGIYFEEIKLITHPVHAELSAVSLQEGLSRYDVQYGGITNLPSGEPEPYSHVVLSHLDWVGRKDPTWDKWQSLHLRLLANRRDNPK